MTAHVDDPRPLRPLLPLPPLQPSRPSPSPWHEACIDGLALWTPAWPGWDAAAPALRAAPIESPTNEAASPTPAPAARPAPGGLAANERRRAPDSVLVALQVAEQAMAQSGHAAASLASVFTSAHGDLPIVDALARTLAGDPKLLSPTRFHHSVHNAPSGYWAIASGSHAASTALAAYDHSFGAGLLEALVQVATEDAPVLLAGCDTGAEGPLASVNTSRGLLGVALVLAPRPGPGTRFVLRWCVAPEAAEQSAGAGLLTRRAAPSPASPSASPFASSLGRALALNAQADALPLFEALARCEARETSPAAAPNAATDITDPSPRATLALRCGPGTVLRLELQERPCAAPG